MANNQTHECIICGQKYASCNNCVKISDFSDIDKSYIERYCHKHNIQEPLKSTMFIGHKSVCDTVQHYMVYGIIRMIKKNEITPQQAKLELSQLGFNTEEIKTFKESVRDFLLNYIGEDEQSKEAEEENSIFVTGLVTETPIEEVESTTYSNEKEFTSIESVQPQQISQQEFSRRKRY